MSRLVMMAFAKAQEVKDAAPFNKYLGCVEAHLEAVNPTKEELKKLLGRDVTDSTVKYTSEVEITDLNGNKKKGKQNRLTFWYSFENPMEESGKTIVSHSIFFDNGPRVGSQSGKIQVCDKYGRFAWATPEEYKGNAIPQYRTGAANISKTYRCAVNGEEDLIELIKCHLGMNLPVERLADGTLRNLTDEELEKRIDEFGCSFEPQDVADIVNGKISAIKNAIMGTNDVKLILSVRHSDKGDYQGVYTIRKRNFTNFTSLEKELNERPLKNSTVMVEGHIPAAVIKYEPKPTNLTENKGAEVEKPENNFSDLPF